MAGVVVGTKVTALTFPDPDRELSAKEIVGELAVHHVDTLNYDQYLVNGIPVQPSTIKRSE